METTAPLDRITANANIRYQAECPYCGKLRGGDDRGELVRWIQHHSDVIHNERIHRIQARRCISRAPFNLTPQPFNGSTIP